MYNTTPQVYRAIFDNSHCTNTFQQSTRFTCERTWLAKEHGLRKDVTCVSEETCGVARRQAKGMPFMEAGKDTYLPCRKCGKYGRNDGSMAVNHGTPARYDVKGDRRTRVFQDPGRQNPGLSGHGQEEQGLSEYGQAGARHFRRLTRCTGYSGT